MQLVMAALVYPVEGEEFQDLELLKLANCWLQRKADGHHDSLLLIGVDFPQVEDLRKRVAPLGLRDADLDVITMDEDRDLGAEVELVVGPWLKTKHASAVSFMNWETLLGDLAVPDLNWWWTGVEAEPADEYSSILGGIDEPPRVSRRLPPLRRWSHEEVSEFFPRGPRARRAHGVGASRGRASSRVTSRHLIPQAPKGAFTTPVMRSGSGV